MSCRFRVDTDTGSSSSEEPPANSREQRLPRLGGHPNPADEFEYFAENRCTKPTMLRVRVAPTDLKMEFRMDYQVTPISHKAAPMIHCENEMPPLSVAPAPVASAYGCG